MRRCVALNNAAHRKGASWDCIRQEFSTGDAIRAGFAVILLSLCCPAHAAVDQSPASDPLPRRPFLGVTAQPAPGQHVRVGKLVPGSSAARSELKEGDILMAINGAPVESVGAFVAGMKSFKSGDRLVVHVQRGAKEMDIEVTLGETPREQPGDIQVIYDTVDAHEATLRSLVTMPIGKPRKLPAILFVQGFDCSSIEYPLADPNLNRELVYRLTRAGFAVMRSEKSGVGDSTGTPCRDVGFKDEVSLFTSALRKLKSYDFVDTDNVFLFGHSAGGWIAPLVAAAEPVKGIVVYGTVVRPFAEYLVENWRRSRWRRTNPDLAQLEDEERQLAQLLHYLLVEKISVAEATAKHPELTAIAKKLFPGDKITSRSPVAAAFSGAERPECRARLGVSGYPGARPVRGIRHQDASDGPRIYRGDRERPPPGQGELADPAEAGPRLCLA